MRSVPARCRTCLHSPSPECRISGRSPGSAAWRLPACPLSIAEKVHTDLVEVLARPEVNAKLAELMLEPVASTPAQAAQFFVEETALWGKVIRDTGVKAQ